MTCHNTLYNCCIIICHITASGFPPKSLVSRCFMFFPIKIDLVCVLSARQSSVYLR